MRVTAEKAATEIRRAYDSYTTQYDTRGDWASITRLMERLDLTVEEFTAGALHLIDSDMDFSVVPESNQRMLTELDQACAIQIGGQWNHLISWQ